MTNRPAWQVDLNIGDAGFVRLRLSAFNQTPVIISCVGMKSDVSSTDRLACKCEMGRPHGLEHWGPVTGPVGHLGANLIL